MLFVYAIYKRIKKRMHNCFHKILSSTTVLNIDSNTKCFLISKSKQIKIVIIFYNIQ